jgi:hypothetical protein
MAEFVTLDQAKAHLQETNLDATREADLVLKLDAAERIVYDYLDLQPEPTVEPPIYPGPPLWPDDINRELVGAAILIQLGELWFDRGDNAEGVRQTDGELSPFVSNLLRRVKRQAIG